MHLRNPADSGWQKQLKQSCKNQFWCWSVSPPTTQRDVSTDVDGKFRLRADAAPFVASIQEVRLGPEQLGAAREIRAPAQLWEFGKENHQHMCHVAKRISNAKDSRCLIRMPPSFQQNEKSTKWIKWNWMNWQWFVRKWATFRDSAASLTQVVDHNLRLRSSLPPYLRIRGAPLKIHENPLVKLDVQCVQWCFISYI